MKLEVIFVVELLKDILDGKLRIPLFQRPFVWSPNQMLEFLDSIRNQYPIGNILLWNTDLIQEYHQKIGPIKITEQKNEDASYVLDGQQRLTTLVSVLNFKIQTINVKPEDWIWQVCYDLKKRRFLHLRQKERPYHYFPMHVISNTFDFLKECKQIQKKMNNADEAQQLINEAEKLAKAFRTYKLSIIRIQSTRFEEAMNIFVRLNFKGCPRESSGVSTFFGTWSGDEKNYD